ncbi:MAG TPA: hypothetical protein VJ842_10730 [Pyrinomonadaceae bacterium]|nr:hypothetical protein [Pyrinomonadaceae bacterium]
MNTPTNKHEKFKDASVHGRFQVPHNDHLKYILAAKQRCDFLWIGIARPDIREQIPCDIAKHRMDRLSNPLTYFERTGIVSEMLVEAGVNEAEFGFVPFPIDQPDRLSDFIPTSIPCFTTICDEWNEHKVEVLRNLGYEVIILWENRNPLITGRKVRELIRGGSGAWRSMVPPATSGAIDRLNLRARLITLME